MKAKLTHAITSKHTLPTWSETGAQLRETLKHEHDIKAELLEALELLLKTHRDGDTTSDILSQCDSAIAKAKGLK